jgi:branched-chain amino acid aminotransferase
MPIDHFTTVFLNGALVNADDGQVSIFDRGFLYGDGLFETIRISGSRPFRWDQHFLRLTGGLRLLSIRLPYQEAELRAHADKLIAANGCRDAVLRLTISRGTGRRGLSPQSAETPTVAMSLHPAPDRTKAAGLRLITSSFRVLAGDPLAAVKSASKLVYVLARQAAEACGADDALILNHRDEVAETTSSNLFWTKGTTLFTAPPEVGILPGVARGIVLELAPRLGFQVHQVTASVTSLWEAESIFATNVVRGVVEVLQIDGHRIHRVEGCGKFARAFEELVKADLT